MPRARTSRIAPLAACLLTSTACTSSADDPPVAPPTPTASTPSTAEAKHLPPKTPPEDPPPQEARLPPPETPPEDPPDTRGPSRGHDERKNPELAGTGTEALLAAFPERIDPWTRTKLRPLPAGMAGRWADGAAASYESGALEVYLEVADMIRVLPCTPGTGATMLAESLAEEPSAMRVKLGAHAAVLYPDLEQPSLGLWLGDRCTLSVDARSDGVAGKDLLTLGAGLDLDGLDAACKRRDPKGPFGL